MRRSIIDKRYRILKKLGTGATGNVYAVRDLKDNRIIALKILSKEKTSSEAVQRFKREFKLLAGLRHPNLCSVYNFGMLKDGRSYFTMEYVDGEDIFEAAKRLPYKKIYPWVVELCRVLEYIHSRGLIHYDVKPDNVLIAKGKKHYAQNPMFYAKLLDFGLASEQRIKGGILIRGTMPYIAPEVVKGLAIDHRADLFSLGVLLYEIFTRRKFQIKDKESFVTFLKQQEKIVSELPSNIVPDIPKRLERLIIRLLEFEPAARFNRANEVIKEINKISGKKFESETEKTLEGYLLSSEFVGREKEMGVLQSLYEKARHGEGKVVLMTGDAGIGKTRLLKEFRIFTQLRRSHSYIGYTHKDKTGPLDPFHDIFRELINYIDDKSKVRQSLAVLFKIYPDLTGGHLRRHLPRLVPLEPQAEKLRTLDALTELIKHCAEGFGELVILLEDLHWSDVLSVQFLEYLGRNLTESNVFICGTCRSEELDNNPTLIKMISNVKNENYFTQLELKPLKFRSLYSFLDSTITPSSNSSELVKYLMKKTSGNPYFIEEIMRTLLKTKSVSIGQKMEIKHFKRISIPKTIEEIVLKRIKDLDNTSREVVKFGAILLKDFSYSLMKHLTGLDDTELSRVLWELKRRRILVEENNRYRFYHATLRDTVNKKLSYQEKRKLNYQVGKILERINKRNLSQVVEDLAFYFINAKDNKKGVAYGLRAAKKSSKRYVNEQTIGFYKGVLDLLSNEDLNRRLDVLQKIAETEYYASLYNDAIRHYNKIMNLKILTIDKKIKIYSRIGDIYGRKGEYNKALQIYQRALKLLKNMKSGSLKGLLEADIKVCICRAYLVIGDYESASKFNFDALKFPKAGLKGTEAILQQCSIYHDMGTFELYKAYFGKGDYEKAISYYQKAYQYWKKLKTKTENSTILINLGNAYSMKFDYQKAFSCYRKSIQISKKRGDHYAVSTGLFNLSFYLIDKGYYSETLDRFQQVLFISKKIGNTAITGSSFNAVGNVFFKLCDFEQSKEYHKKALEIFNTMGWEYKKIDSLLGIGNTYQVMGNYTMAMRFYRRSLKIAKSIENPDEIAKSFMNIGAVLIEIGEFSKAKRYIADALKIAIAIKEKKIEIGCYIYLCRISIMMEDCITAIGYYKTGITLVKKIGMRQESSRFFLLMSDIYYHGKKYIKGIGVATRAIKLAKDMGTKDLHAEALLMKAKNEMKRGVLANIEILTILNEAKRIAEEINCPEILWKIYFTYGKLLQEDKQYPKALEYYQKCHRIFTNIGSNIESEIYRMSYLSRSDRKEVYTAKKEIKNLFC